MPPTWIHGGIGCPRCYAAHVLAEMAAERARDADLDSYPYLWGRACAALEQLAQGSWRLCPKHRVRRKLCP